MATISQVKTYGGVGSLLILFAPVPTVGWLLAIAGFILSLMAVKTISELVRDSTIWNNMLISIVTALAGVMVAFFVILASVFRFIGWSNLVGWGPDFNPATIAAGDWMGLVTTILLGLAVMWILVTISGVYFRRGYSKIGSALNIKLFGTAGLIFLIGAATTIVLVGFLLIPIAIILLIVAYFSINESTFQGFQTTVPPSTR